MKIQTIKDERKKLTMNLALGTLLKIIYEFERPSEIIEHYKETGERLKPYSRTSVYDQA